MPYINDMVFSIFIRFYLCINPRHICHGTGLNENKTLLFALYIVVCQKE